MLCGHTTLRLAAMGPAALERAASEAELAAMAGQLSEALSAGAIGLSSGLAYASAATAPPEELLSLAMQVRPSHH